jgi:hypothetical protein
VLLSWLWKRVEKSANEQIRKQKKVDVSNVSVNIPGLGPVPVETFTLIATQIVPRVIAGLKSGHDAETILKTLKATAEPALLSTVEVLLNVAFPGAGTLLGILVWLVENSKPLSQEDLNKWMDRFGAGAES